MTENNENKEKAAPKEHGVNLYLRNLEQTLLNREWLETRSKLELMDLVQFLSVQLYKQSTSQLKKSAKTEADVKFPSVGTENMASFEAVPAG